MKILVIQNSVKEKYSDNITNLNKLLSQTKSKKYDFIIFPEMFVTPYELKYFKKYKHNKNSPIFDYLKEISRKYSSYVIGGSIPEAFNNNIYNTSYIFNREGEIIAKYRKIHLFSVTYPDNTTFSEADVLSPGNKIITFDTEFGKMGIIICFDIRFPILSKKIRDKGAKIIFVPGAFNTYTGPMHWHTTFKARAIDNQIFFVGASPSYYSFGNYEPYGHSLVVDPFGKIIHELDNKEGLIEANIDLKVIDKARSSIPIIKNEIDLNIFV
ncbi:MAG: carbon-nitrogen hydrolase family protein [Candidatus Izimaplasma sp.]|nr:carbon-nitrogen hydrolase family protein [Candidatus Izimaplasma bacterium]